MWDWAQKKALKKILNLVTNKSCPKRPKGAKMGDRKTCVFFNSGSIQYRECPLDYQLVRGTLTETLMGDRQTNEDNNENNP